MRTLYLTKDSARMAAEKTGLKMIECQTFLTDAWKGSCTLACSILELQNGEGGFGCFLLTNGDAYGWWYDSNPCIFDVVRPDNVQDRCQMQYTKGPDGSRTLTGGPEWVTDDVRANILSMTEGD